jgi:hypothetical protein
MVLRHGFAGRLQWPAHIVRARAGWPISLNFLIFHRSIECDLNHARNSVDGVKVSPAFVFEPSGAFLCGHFQPAYDRARFRRPTPKEKPKD